MSKIFNISSRGLIEAGVLNKTEILLFKEIQRFKKPLSIKELSSLLKLKRLTILYNLKKLEKFGLVIRNFSHKDHRWGLREERHKIEASEKEISIYEAYKIVGESSAQKIYGIQGGEAIKNIIKLIEKESDLFVKSHVRQKLRQVIIDGILTEGGAEIIRKLPIQILKSHFGRPSILHLIPDNSFINNLEILSDGKLLVIIDHNKQKAQIINNLFANEAFRAFLEIIKTSGIKKNPTEIYGELN